MNIITKFFSTNNISNINEPLSRKRKSSINIENYEHNSFIKSFLNLDSVFDKNNIYR